MENKKPVTNVAGFFMSYSKWNFLQERNKKEIVDSLAILRFTQSTTRDSNQLQEKAGH
jgi:hypothetical protein